VNLKLTLAASIAAFTILAAGSALAATAEVNTDANVRDGAGTEYDIIGHLSEGDEIECVDFDEGWCELADGDGYVAGSLIDVADGGDDDDDDHHDDHWSDDVDVEVEFGSGGWEVELEL
jgi:uncharacterized protein YraI